MDASCTVWWVGGGVRDLLRGEGNLDLDLVVEGDMDAFLDAFVARSGGAVVSRSRFLTARLRLAGERLDVARARQERYPAPGALPVVAEGTVLDDLGRRDFSVNAMAISVAPELGARFLDPHDGRRDLVARQLRILHPGSFEDDPTRILRAIDFAARFGFALEPGTEAEARSILAAGGLLRLSPRRRGAALERMLGRPRTAVLALDLAQELGALHAIDTGLRWDAETRFRLIRSLSALERESGAAAAATNCFLLTVLILAENDDLKLPARLAGSLSLHRGSATIVAELRERSAEAMRLGPRSRASHAHRCLRSLHEVELARLAALREDLESWVRRENETMRPLRLTISGDDLRRRGVVEGPHLGRALLRTLDARLDGEIAATGELAFALAVASESRSES